MDKKPIKLTLPPEAVAAMNEPKGVTTRSRPIHPHVVQACWGVVRDSLPKKSLMNITKGGVSLGTIYQQIVIRVMESRGALWKPRRMR